MQHSKISLCTHIFIFHWHDFFSRLVKLQLSVQETKSLTTYRLLQSVSRCSASIYHILQSQTELLSAICQLPFDADFSTLRLHFPLKKKWKCLGKLTINSDYFLPAHVLSYENKDALWDWTLLCFRLKPHQTVVVTPHFFFISPWVSGGHSAVHSTFPEHNSWDLFSQWQCHHSYHQSLECRWAIPVLANREALKMQWRNITCSKGSLVRIYDTHILSWRKEGQVGETGRG